VRRSRRHILGSGVRVFGVLSHLVSAAVVEDDTRESELHSNCNLNRH